mgnify:CR=1 FL=1
MYPEKICANSFVQKLSMINKVCPVYNSALAETYTRLLKDFLIVTCAQAQDIKNPNCIRDIKSLKILYPSGLGCAIDMKHLIHCIISILKLQNEEPNKEFESLKF